MEWDIDKLADFLEQEAQAGVAIEHKILEWKIAEAKLKSQAPAIDVQREFAMPERASA